MRIMTEETPIVMAIKLDLDGRIAEGDEAMASLSGEAQRLAEGAWVDVKADLLRMRKVLIAIREMKTCLTRRGLFYTSWPLYKHWKTGKIHMNFGQSRAATRRFTPNAPNGNQLPKKNEGKKVRRIVKAPKGYILCTMDFTGQELKLAAWQSQDPTFLSCSESKHIAVAIADIVTPARTIPACRTAFLIFSR